MPNNFKRTHFFIDKEIQGKYMVTLLVPLLIMLALFSVLLFFTLNFGIQFSIDSLSTQISDQISFSFQGISKPSAQQYSNLLESIRDLVYNFSKNEKILEFFLLAFLVDIFGVFFRCNTTASGQNLFIFFIAPYYRSKLDPAAISPTNPHPTQKNRQS